MSAIEIVVATAIFVALLSVILTIIWLVTVGKRFNDDKEKLRRSIVESEAQMNMRRYTR